MKQIVLLGTAPGSMGLAPYNNPDWEIWSCSPGTMAMTRHDKFFELHRWEPGQTWFSEAYVKFLENFEGEVIMTDVQAEATVRNFRLLEWERLVKKYGDMFFTSSLAWMCAMAIEAKPDKIAFYGVDMAATSEYHDQRMGCQYFAMLAASMGIEVGVPPESDLLRPPPLYGVCESSHAWIKSTARARELSGRLREQTQVYENAREQIGFLRGAMDDQDWHLHSFIGQKDSMGQTYTSPIVPEVLLKTPNPAYPNETGDITVKGNGEDLDWGPLPDSVMLKNMVDQKLNEETPPLDDGRTYTVIPDPPGQGKAKIRPELTDSHKETMDK